MTAVGLLGTASKREEVVRPEGLEPPAYRFEACRSIQLSYGRIVRINERLAEWYLAPGCTDAIRRAGQIVALQRVACRTRSNVTCRHYDEC